jgi:hypothetical protein
MTPEERRKRMEERMAAMTPEERAAFQERMAARQNGQGGGRGGFGGGFGNGQAPGTANPAGAPGAAQAGAARTQPGATRGAAGPQGRVASVPSMRSGATTIDSLFGPLPTVETRGRAWLFINKQLKPVSLRLGISDGTNTEVLDGNELQVGTEVVTNIILPTSTTQPAGATGTGQSPLMGPQRGGPGGRGGGRGGI